MAPHSGTGAWKVPWTEEPGRLYSPWGLEESNTTERLHFHFSLSCTGEGSGSPFWYSCLENPRDWSLVGFRLWGHTELDTTEATQQQQQQDSEWVMGELLFPMAGPRDWAPLPTGPSVEVSEVAVCSP